MPINQDRVLALAAGNGAVAWVFLVKDRPKDWRLSRKAAQDPTQARSFIRIAIARKDPDIVLLEDPNGLTRKQGNTLKNLRAIAQDLADQGLPHYLLERSVSSPNKHVAAQALVQCYPELTCELRPKPRSWQSEPKSMLYFEAVGLVEERRVLTKARSLHRLRGQFD